MDASTRRMDGVASHITQPSGRCSDEGVDDLVLDDIDEDVEETDVEGPAEVAVDKETAGAA